jgi:hypothetical protein
MACLLVVGGLHFSILKYRRWGADAQNSLLTVQDEFLNSAFQKLNLRTRRVEIDAQKLSSGIYSVSVHAARGINTRKLVVINWCVSLFTFRPLLIANE